MVYVFYEPKFRQNRERNKFVSALILHWRWKFAKQDNFPSEDEIEPRREMLIERVKVWAWSDPQLWADYYPYEKYSEDPFEILDVLIAREEEWKKWKKEQGL